MRSIKTGFKITLLGMMVVVFSAMAMDKKDIYIVDNCKLSGYQDTTGKGTFFWNGDYFVGKITIWGNANKIDASWEFVKITSSISNKSVILVNSIAYSYKCGGVPQITNLKIKDDIITFDLHLDNACHDCSVFHMVGSKSKRNSFYGTGNQISYVDKKYDRYEFRPVEEIELPSKKVF